MTKMEKLLIVPLMYASYPKRLVLVKQSTQDIISTKDPENVRSSTMADVKEMPITSGVLLIANGDVSQKTHVPSQCILGPAGQLFLDITSIKLREHVKNSIMEDAMATTTTFKHY